MAPGPKIHYYGEGNRKNQTACGNQAASVQLISADWNYVDCKNCKRYATSGVDLKAQQDMTVEGGDGLEDELEQL